MELWLIGMKGGISGAGGYYSLLCGGGGLQMWRFAYNPRFPRQH